ncbi:hypothetical protein [Mangrovicoccus algicola]|uniref:Holin n=1 Tax=Mangrovicoccus algicola TaxID=2771008 RepID=A0A8J7CGS9_9RHOB|nr:hypothetical protein [Mangrovicoccus algicola]MBE3637455.1 hypothetical protein [Mangrovicoccus algicola]
MTDPTTEARERALDPLAFWKARSVLLPSLIVILTAFGIDVPAMLDVATTDLAAQRINTILTTVVAVGAALLNRKNPKRKLALTDAYLKKAAEVAASAAPAREKVTAIARGLLK